MLKFKIAFGKIAIYLHADYKHSLENCIIIKRGWLSDHKKSIQHNSAFMSHAEMCSNTNKKTKVKQGISELSRTK